MWTSFVAGFYSILFAFLMVFNGAQISLPKIDESAEIEYAYADEVDGNAGGTVTVNSKYAGTYDLYWGDEDGKRLKMDGTPFTEFAEVRVEDGSGSTDVYEFTAIPEGAETVLAFKGAVLCGKTEIPEEKQADDGDALYTFGVLSDVHYDRYNLSLTGDDAVITFKNALNFLDRYGVSVVGLSGDISTKSETDAFEKYNKTVSAYDFPVYTSTGNHDVGYGEFLDRWTSLVNVDAYHEPVREGICDVADNGLDFVYAPDALGGDVFLFLSQIDWSYNSPDSRLLADEQLDWLASELEKYRDRRVYLFFHTFMADDNGDPRLGEGNLLNDKGVTYDLVYTVGTADEVRFRALLREYKNVIFFNGHSHWEFEGVSMNPIMNITDYDGAYATFVHVPSVSSPRRTLMGSTNVFEQYMRSSQGYLVKVYEDKIVLFGTQFWGERFLSFATFNIYR